MSYIVRDRQGEIVGLAFDRSEAGELLGLGSDAAIEETLRLLQEAGEVRRFRPGSGNTGRGYLFLAVGMTERLQIERAGRRVRWDARSKYDYRDPAFQQGVDQRLRNRLFRS